MRCLEFLPEYMRCCYQAILDVYDEVKQDISKEGREFCMHYAEDEVRRTFILIHYPRFLFFTQ